MCFYCEDRCIDKQILGNVQIPWCSLGGCDHFQKNETQRPPPHIFFLEYLFHQLTFLWNLALINHNALKIPVSKSACKGDMNLVCEHRSHSARSHNVLFHHFPLQVILTELTEHKVFNEETQCWGVRTLNSKSDIATEEKKIQQDFHKQPLKVYCFLLIKKCSIIISKNKLTQRGKVQQKCAGKCIQTALHITTMEI